MANIIPIKKKPLSNLIPMLDYKVRQYHYSPEEIAMCIGTKENTWFRRKRQPEQFRLSELQELSKRLDVTITISNGITVASENVV